MKVEFGAMEETAIPGFKGGEGVTHARMFADGRNRIMRGRLEGAPSACTPMRGAVKLCTFSPARARPCTAARSGWPRRLSLLPGGARPLPDQRRDTAAGVLRGGAPARMSGI